MLRRFCAISLVILAAVPFTAPFATLDWSDFIRGKQSCQVLGLAAPVVSSHPDDADDMASLDARVQRVRPMGSALPPAASPVAGGASTSAAAIVVPVSSAPPERQSSALAAVLRV